MSAEQWAVLATLYGIGAACTLGHGLVFRSDGRRNRNRSDVRYGARAALAAPIWPVALAAALVFGVGYVLCLIASAGIPAIARLIRDAIGRQP